MRQQLFAGVAEEVMEAVSAFSTFKMRVEINRSEVDLADRKAILAD
jgi:hypothetical protein